DLIGQSKIKNTTQGIISTRPQIQRCFSFIRGSTVLNRMLLKTQTSRDEIAIHRNDHGGLPVSTSQKAIVNPAKKPYIDPMTTANAFGFLKNKAIKNRLNSGAIKRPLVLAVTSIMLPGTSGMSKLSRNTTTPSTALLSRILTSSF